MARFATVLKTSCVGLLFAGAAARAADPAPIVHFSFDKSEVKDKVTTIAEDNGAKNSSGQKLVAVMDDPNQVSLTPGKFGQAVTFAGNTGSALKLPYISGMNLRSFTLSCWVNLSQNDRNFILVDWPEPNHAYMFGIDNSKDKVNSRLNVILRSATVSTRTDKKTKKQTIGNYTDVVNVVSDATVTPNEWHHVAYVWNRANAAQATMTVYLDGTPAGQGTVKAGVEPNIKLNQNPIYIGFKEDTKSYFHGSIDELWIYNDALDATQIKNLMTTNSLKGGDNALAMVTPNNGTATPPSPSPAPPAPTTYTPPTPSPVPQRDTPRPTPNPTPAVVVETPKPPAVDMSKPPDEAPIVARSTTAAEPSRNSGNDNGTTNDAGNRMATAGLASPGKQFTPARITGIVTSGACAMGLLAFFIWGTNERRKLKLVR